MVAALKKVDFPQLGFPASASVIMMSASVSMHSVMNGELERT
jgi:hypothetical protein